MNKFYHLVAIMYLRVVVAGIVKNNDSPSRQKLGSFQHPVLKNCRVNFAVIIAWQE